MSGVDYIIPKEKQADFCAKEGHKVRFSDAFLMDIGNRFVFCCGECFKKNLPHSCSHLVQADFCAKKNHKLDVNDIYGWPENGGIKLVCQECFTEKSKCRSTDYFKDLPKTASLNPSYLAYCVECGDIVNKEEPKHHHFKSDENGPHMFSRLMYYILSDKRKPSAFIEELRPQHYFRQYAREFEEWKLVLDLITPDQLSFNLLKNLITKCSYFQHVKKSCLMSHKEPIGTPPTTDVTTEKTALEPKPEPEEEEPDEQVADINPKEFDPTKLDEIVESMDKSGKMGEEFTLSIRGKVKVYRVYLQLLDFERKDETNKPAPKQMIVDGTKTCCKFSLGELLFNEDANCSLCTNIEHFKVLAKNTSSLEIKVTWDAEGKDGKKYPVVKSFDIVRKK